MKESIYNNNKTISKIQRHKGIGDQGEGFQITLREINQARISKILCVWVCRLLGWLDVILTSWTKSKIYPDQIFFFKPTVMI